MKITVTDLGDCKRQMDVEVPYDEIVPHVEKAYKKYQSRVHIDGFRQGKVPMSLLKKRFGDAIQSEVADDMVQHYFRAAVLQEKLDIVAPGAIQKLNFEEGQPLTFTAEVEVEPEIEVKDYKGLKLEKTTVQVSGEDVDKTVEMLREQKADRREIEAGARMGDVVEGDVQALDASGVAMVGERWENRQFELGEPPIGHLIGEQLNDVKKGDTRRFSITVPASETGEESDRIDNYEITVKSVKEKVLPTLDDAFAQSVGEYETLEALKTHIRERITAQQEEESERGLRYQMIDTIIQRNDFVLPEAMIENVLQAMWEDFQKQPQAQLTRDQYVQAKRPEVVWNLKWSKIWSKIAEVETLAVTDEELQAEIDKAVNASGKEDKKLKVWFNDETRRRRLRDNLLEDKVIALIKAEAKIKDVAPKKAKK